MHQEEAAEAEIERRAARRFELEHVGADEVEPGAAAGAKVAERLGGESGVDLDAGDDAVGADAVGHQPHHRAGAGADIEAGHAGLEPNAIEHLARGPFPHPRLIAETLVLLGVACMNVAVRIGLAGLRHDVLDVLDRRRNHGGW
jgi:hypothetical protein